MEVRVRRVVGNGASKRNLATASEPVSWNESTCRLAPRHLEMAMGWI